ncbi:MAG: hypothetical protein GTO24_23730 [candidate division Zixibacteria bacterium]|nr:hypothetical protein [candidate division Zixibacteria bacterium]
MVRLSKKYGIITEYTSFLVDADYRLAAHELAPQAEIRLQESSREVVGAGAVDRAKKSKAYVSAPMAPSGYLDAEGKEQKLSNIVQTGNRTFFNKNGLWVDSEYEGKIEAIKVQRFSEAYFKLLTAIPEVGRYFALGDEVIFLLRGTAIHIADQGKADFTASELNSLLSP